ncbi:MAG: carbohydrate kinase [Candidatus Eremiobacteraeota bacterium]|nr:carbohydrate kinase [Candidatus Eremiobacteraeota bacterium]
MLPAERIDRALLRRWPMPVPEAGSKEERGEVFVVAGAAQTPGAAILAATSALRAGAGKLKVATAASVAAHVAAAVPESLVVALDDLPSGGFAIENAPTIVGHANGADALVLGPGLIDEAASGSLACAVLAQLTTPVLLDAAALAGCATDPDVLHRLGGRAVLTPHAGEMARMMGTERNAVEEDPARFARDAARRLRAMVVMKGATTYVAQPDGALFCNIEGDVGLATSGSGDTLAGIIGGLLARGLPPLGAAVWGVYLHAQAGRALSQRIGLGFLAREIPDEIPGLMRWAE